MRDNLIAFIKAFQAEQDGGENGRSMVTLGNVGEITLAFGYGYFDRDKVHVTLWNPDGRDDPREMKVAPVEAAVDAFLAYYDIA